MYINQVADKQRRLGIIAQLGEHLPYKQGVTGSSPVGPISQDKLFKFAMLRMRNVTTTSSQDAQSASHSREKHLNFN